MLPPRIVWKILRDLGPFWVVKRIKLETERRLGIIERRLPVADWDFESRDWLRDDAPENPEGIKASLRQKARFFFDTCHLPRPADANVCDQAERVLNGEWPYFSHNWFKVGFPPDWHLNPLDECRFDDREHWSRPGNREASDVKFIWEASRFSIVYLLVRAYAVTANEEFVEAFWRLIEDWADKNPPNRGVNWASGQEAAVRVMAWCFGLYTFLESQASTAERVFRLVRMIGTHGERIAGFIEYALSQRNNHGISEAVGLFTIGRLFPQLRRASEWQRYGRDLIIRQLGEQVYEDGSYIQHSFNYERVLIDNLVWAFRLGELNDCRFPHESYKVLERAVGFTLRFCDAQTGKMPNYGGNDGSVILPLTSCDYNDFRASIQAAHYLVYQRPAFPAGAWNETAEWLCNSSERNTNSLNAEILRDDVKDATCSVPTGYLKLQGRESWAMLRAAHYIDRPAQADQLHFDLWWRGENIACDAGTYLYSGCQPWTNALAATTVHNTVTVDHRDQMTRASRFLWVDWAQAEAIYYHVGQFATAVQAWHNGYKKLGIIHKRGVVNLEDSWIVVDDLCGDVRPVRLHWLFPDYEFAWEQYECRLRMQTAAGPFQCHLSVPADSAVSLARAGKILVGVECAACSRDLQIRGWRSLYYGEKTPALSLSAECRAPARFITVLATAEVTVMKMSDEAILLRMGNRDYMIALASRGAERIFAAVQR